jgi:hypothetical protein
MISIPRISAIFTLSLVFTLIIAVAILGTQSIGTQITHGNMVEHKHGIILSASVDNRLEFKTDSGEIMHFTCSKRCLTELEHIQRHINEHAPTDVYYKSENNTLAAVDVD